MTSSYRVKYINILSSLNATTVLDIHILSSFFHFWKSHNENYYEKVTIKIMDETEYVETCKSLLFTICVLKRRKWLFGWL